MDVNVLRIAVTVVSLFVFVGIVAWAWSRRNQAAFDEAAQLPFQESRP
jgi:cytochrome c oxidase cbb3-type subunit IV